MRIAPLLIALAAGLLAAVALAEMAADFAAVATKIREIGR